MRRGYSHDIRAEAIVGRFRGKGWKEIQAGIGEKFGVKPSIRQMQKWFEDYKGTTDDPTGVRLLAQVVEESAKRVQPLVQAKMMSDIIPLWSRLCDQWGLEAEEAGWVAMWLFFEVQLGREKLDFSYSLYQRYRDKLSREIGMLSKEAWPSPPWVSFHRDSNGKWWKKVGGGEWHVVDESEIPEEVKKAYIERPTPAAEDRTEI